MDKTSHQLSQSKPVTLEDTFKETVDESSIEFNMIRERKISPWVRLAITTLAPFSFAPYASALPAPPAPITTNSLLANGDIVVVPTLCNPIETKLS